MLRWLWPHAQRRRICRDKPNATQADFNQDNAACQLVAMNAPQQQTPQQPLYNGGSLTTYNATTNGNYYGNTYTGNTYGMAVTTPTQNPYAGLANGIAALGDAMANRARQQQALRLCMQARGYTLRTDAGATNTVNYAPSVPANNEPDTRQVASQRDGLRNAALIAVRNKDCKSAEEIAHGSGDTSLAQEIYGMCARAQLVAAGTSAPGGTQPAQNADVAVRPAASNAPQPLPTHARRHSNTVVASIPPNASPSRAVGDTHNCSAFYPEESLKVQETGDVLVRYDVGADGGVSNVRIGTSSGSPRLDEAAILCVSIAWRNTPAMIGKVPVASPGHQAIVRFNIDAPTPPANVSASGSDAEPYVPESGIHGEHQ